MNEPQIDMKLEVVLLGVSDVDRMKAFLRESRLAVDIDIANGDFRGVQITPHHRKPRSSLARESLPQSPAP
jgi:hypothetical protein